MQIYEIQIIILCKGKYFFIFLKIKFHNRWWTNFDRIQNCINIFLFKWYRLNRSITHPKKKSLIYNTNFRITHFWPLQKSFSYFNSLLFDHCNFINKIKDNKILAVTWNDQINIEFFVFLAEEMRPKEIETFDWVWMPNRAI